MKSIRSFRVVAACIALFSMLFMQLAVAAYACPGASMGGQSVAVPSVAMAGCEGMDRSQPTLCHVYARGDAAKQSLDKPPAFDVPPFVPMALVMALDLVERSSLLDDAPWMPALRSRSTAPPIAIRHCCFRI